MLVRRPFSHYCSFCEVSYDVIGTMEDFDEDVEFIATKMNISELLDHKGAYTYDVCNGGRAPKKENQVGEVA